MSKFPNLNVGTMLLGKASSPYKVHCPDVASPTRFQDALLRYLLSSFPARTNAEPESSTPIRAFVFRLICNAGASGCETRSRAWSSSQ